MIIKIANELFSYNGFRDKRNSKISKALKKRFNNLPFEPASTKPVITYRIEEIEEVRKELNELEKKLFNHEKEREKIKEKRNSINRIVLPPLWRSQGLADDLLLFFPSSGFDQL